MFCKYLYWLYIGKIGEKSHFETTKIMIVIIIIIIIVIIIIVIKIIIVIIIRRRRTIKICRGKTKIQLRRFSNLVLRSRNKC